MAFARFTLRRARNSPQRQALMGNLCLRNSRARQLGMGLYSNQPSGKKGDTHKKGNTHSGCGVAKLGFPSKHLLRSSQHMNTTPLIAGGYLS